MRWGRAQGGKDFYRRAKTDQPRSNDSVAERAGSIGQCLDPTNLDKMP